MNLMTKNRKKWNFGHFFGFKAKGLKQKKR
ncbi:hypothetical protein Q787_06000 [Ornithobacterium rhinotracheale H06-030791]|nr:hypothetical protein Q785_06110 [Ornithobacterium rhinotracheale ORT-UMN 88]KGB67531.1 hypothetical protein Q787_06000 [Ornithobacterium rhinotracheale H06-030791]